ncbi:unnamed protein product [Musa acuminata subsp. malaccensis]|uniref:(wild Malaysian banana) hypothetical protein n=1 Tax=Musa acuminata subsp. malaccensis TaxID=214687 RepID=A0A804IER4_MUSAM|nr:unnamed protein product [Musa acuminata subsp. malaccensis]
MLNCFVRCLACVSVRLVTTVFFLGEGTKSFQRMEAFFYPFFFLFGI